MEQLLLSRKKSAHITKAIVVDILMLGVIYLLPTLSHFLSFPLYQLDPMRIAVFASIILLRNKNNSYLLAATIPLFSYFIGGHPVIIKSLIIIIELLVNVSLFWILIQNWRNVFFVTLVSIVVSKLVYYALKFTLIYIGWIHMDIISTSVLLQLFVALTISGAMFFFKGFNLNSSKRPF